MPNEAMHRLTAPRQNHKVYLTSYMRPEMTEKSLQEILVWPNLDRLVVIIDGLRGSANLQERIWREQTIAIVESYGIRNSKLDLWIYDSNIGITNHAMRIQERALQSGSSGIWLEEDIGMDLERYSGLVENTQLILSDEPFLLSAFTHFNHDYVGTSILKNNLFLPLWGIVFNESFYNLISKVWSDKNFKANVVANAINPIFPDLKYLDRIHKKKVVDFWTEYSSWGFQNQNRWDAVANYALWTESKYSWTPFTQLAYDLSYKDSRGMNQRIKPHDVGSHSFDERSTNGHLFCLGCERWGSRFDRSLLKRASSSLRYRLNSFPH
jgi:hypothetical protein